MKARAAALRACIVVRVVLCVAALVARACHAQRAARDPNTTLTQPHPFAFPPDASRGFDHGTFVPLMVSFPAADIPTTQLSLLRSLDPRAHLALGAALAPLRDEGVLVIGSAMSYHNMRGLMARVAHCG
jgi:hypothetical protein